MWSKVNVDFGELIVANTETLQQGRFGPFR
jgi:hypothetical protein